MTRSSTALSLAAFLVFLTSGTAAHDIPSDVRVKMFVKPEGQRLHVLVRVPLASIVETAWPERRPGILDLSGADSPMRAGATSRVADDLELYEGDRRLDAPRIGAIKASLPSDRSFDAYESALSYINSPPLPDTTEFVIAQGLMDVVFEYSIQSDRSDFAIRPNFERLGVTVQTEVLFLPPDGPARAFSLHNDPGLVHLDPDWLQVVRMFVGDGFRHIVTGADHLLFLFVLIIPFVPTSFTSAGAPRRRSPAEQASFGSSFDFARDDPERVEGSAWSRALPSIDLSRLGSLLAIMTSFVVAHSVALVASSYDMTPSALWFPAFVDTLVAASILYVALENLIAPNLRRRWMIAFGFGLAHGFAFALALGDSLQFSGTHFLTSLLSFNVGLELGLLAVLGVMVAALSLVFRFVAEERIGAVILSLLVAHTSWHWTLDRYGAFRRYQFVWPALDAAFFVIVVRWLIVAVVLAGLAWLIFGVLGQRKEAPTQR